MNTEWKVQMLVLFPKLFKVSCPISEVQMVLHLDIMFTLGDFVKVSSLYCNWLDVYAIRVVTSAAAASAAGGVALINSSCSNSVYRCCSHPIQERPPPEEQLRLGRTDPEAINNMREEHGKKSLDLFRCRNVLLSSCTGGAN